MQTHGDYEHSDAQTRPLWVAGVVLVLLLAGSMWVSHRIDRRLTAAIEAGQEASPVSELRRPPEAPELQALPALELRRQRAAEEAALHGPATWIDPVNGIVRIPIETAMERVLAEGFPLRTEEER